MHQTSARAETVRRAAQPLDAVGHLQRVTPGERSPANHRRRLDRFGGQPALFGHSHRIFQILLDLAALIGRRGGAVASQGEIREILKGHQLERKHLAHQRLGRQAQIAVDPAKSVVALEDAGPVFPFGQKVLGLPPATPHQKLLTAIVGMMLPVLLTQPLEVALVEPNERTTTTATAPWQSHFQ